MRKLSSALKISLALYKEVEIYASFAADLDASTTHTLNRGSKLIELLKQPKHKPLSLNHQIVLLFAGIHGYFDSVPKEMVAVYKKALFFYADNSNIFYEINHYKDLVVYPFKVFMDYVLKY